MAEQRGYERTGACKPGGARGGLLGRESESPVCVFTSLIPCFLSCPVTGGRALRAEAILTMMERGAQRKPVWREPSATGEATEDRNLVNTGPNHSGAGRERTEMLSRASGSWATPLQNGATCAVGPRGEVDQTIPRCGGPGRIKPQGKANPGQAACHIVPLETKPAALL